MKMKKKERGGGGRRRSRKEGEVQEEEEEKEEEEEERGVLGGGGGGGGGEIDIARQEELPFRKRYIIKRIATSMLRLHDFQQTEKNRIKTKIPLMSVSNRLNCFGGVICSKSKFDLTILHEKTQKGGRSA